MTTIERNGKFYLQLLDGEKELSIEEIERHKDFVELFQKYADAFEQKFGNYNWSIADIPEHADCYLFIDAEVQEFKKLIQEEYKSAQDKDEVIRNYKIICTSVIGQIKKEQALPFPNHSLCKYRLACWEDLERFVGYFELYKENEVASNISTGTELGKIDEVNRIRSVIKEQLGIFKEKMDNSNYANLTNVLIQYFETDKFPKNSSKILFTGRINIKAVGWALNQIFRTLKENRNLDIIYIRYAKENISIFEKTQFDAENFTKCTLYKYFTNKTLVKT